MEKIEQTSRLVKGEDLNHHKTLFAGKVALWVVECAFITAAGRLGHTNGLVCVGIHGLEMNQPVALGEILTLEGMVVHLGQSSLTVAVWAKARESDTLILQAFVPFVAVDQDGKPCPHGQGLPEANSLWESDLRQLAQKWQSCRKTF